MVAALLAVGAGDLQAQDITHKLQLGSAHPPGRLLKRLMQVELLCC